MNSFAAPSPTRTGRYNTIERHSTQQSAIGRLKRRCLFVYYCTAYLHGRGKYADRKQFPIPHLMLLDLRLPKVDGLDVLKEVKTNENLRPLPVVILTTSDAERDMAMAYEYHANSYVTKPVNFDDFSRLLKDLGFFWLAWNKHPW